MIFPEPPEKLESNEPLGDGESAVVTQYTDQSLAGTFFAYVTELPAHYLASFGAPAIVAGEHDNFVEFSAGMQVTDERSVAVNGFSGKQFIGRDVNGNAWITRFFLVGGRWYQVGVAGPDPTDQAPQAFLESFQLTGTP